MKEKKIILLIQLLISIISIVFLINGLSIDNYLINYNTNEPLNLFENFICFGFYLFIFGSLWSASLIVCIVEFYLLIKCFLLKTSNFDENFFNYQTKYSFIIGFISACIVLLVKI